MEIETIPDQNKKVEKIHNTVKERKEGRQPPRPGFWRVFTPDQVMSRSRHVYEME